jgi:1,4-dihydroxy-2-naphthoate polyprenyltransferase
VPPSEIRNPTSDISRARAWLLASRPKTLPASAAPVIVATAVAYAEKALAPLPALVALLCALLLQVGTNLANDYFDFIKGADTAARIGPVRVTQSGLIAPATVRNAMIGVFALTFVLGLYLVAHAGLTILWIGLASILFAVLYTAGPFPLAYIGLGDLFVFIFFGVVAVNGAYFVQAGRWSLHAMTASLPMGFLTTAIIVVNNYRDIDNDRIAGKRTMAVRLGRRASRLEYLLLLFLAYSVPMAQYLGGPSSPWMLLPLASIPFALLPLRTVFVSMDGPALNRALARTGQLVALFGLLYAAAFVLSGPMDGL